MVPGRILGMCSCSGIGFLQITEANSCSDDSAAAANVEQANQDAADVDILRADYCPFMHKHLLSVHTQQAYQVTSHRKMQAQSWEGVLEVCTHNPIWRDILAKPIRSR